MCRDYVCYGIAFPAQLAKENKKFIYGLVREGARAKEYETAIMWLCDCGLVHKVSRVNAAGIPLRAYEDLKAFKLFVLDVGLLGCMAGLRQHTLLDGNDLFVEFKGALTEQYVCQQLKNIEDLDIYYYTNDRGSCEVDFVVDTGEKIVPVEVKAEVNLKAKSLKTYREKFLPGNFRAYIDGGLQKRRMVGESAIVCSGSDCNCYRLLKFMSRNRCVLHSGDSEKRRFDGYCTGVL